MALQALCANYFKPSGTIRTPVGPSRIRSSIQELKSNCGPSHTFCSVSLSTILLKPAMYSGPSAISVIVLHAIRAGLSHSSVVAVSAGCSICELASYSFAAHPGSAEPFPCVVLPAGCSVRLALLLGVVHRLLGRLPSRAALKPCLPGCSLQRSRRVTTQLDDKSLRRIPA